AAAGREGCAAELVVLDGGFVDEHDRNVVLDRIHALTGRAFQCGPVLDQCHRCLAVGARENFEQLLIDGHVGNSMTPPSFCGTIPNMKLAAFVAALSLFSPVAASPQA